MSLPVYISVIFMGCLIAFCFLLFKSIKLYPQPVDENDLPEYIPRNPSGDEYNTNYMPPRKKYSIFSRMISGLGNLLNGGAKYFNLAVKIMGFGICLLGVNAFAKLPSTWMNVAGFIAFEMGGIGLIFLGIFTENRHPKHCMVANVAFGGFLTSTLIWWAPMQQSTLFFSKFWIFNLFPILTFAFHLYAVRSFDLHLEMQDHRPKKLVKNYDFSEWLMFLSVCCWILMIFISLFI